MEPLLDEIFDGTLDGDTEYVVETVREALEAGISAERILDHALIEAMAEVGELYEEGVYFVPEMMMAARAMQAALAVLRPHLVAESVQPAGRVVIGTVQDDFHEIGKNLVAMMLEGAGFEVRNLGNNVVPERFVSAVADGDVDVVALSTLLVTTIPNMAATIQALQSAGLRQQVKVIVGGTPVNAQNAREIGADGYAPDASQAVRLVQSLVHTSQFVHA
jgi:5-methyltetrahydrofolate--homocysteine methyltransferase